MDPRGLPHRRLDGPVQDPVCGHVSRLTTDFRNLAGIWNREKPTSREWTSRVSCVIYPLPALGLDFAYREPKGLVAVGGYAQAAMLPLIAGAILPLGRHDTDRRVAPIFLTEAINRLAFFDILAVAIFSACPDLVWRRG